MLGALAGGAPRLGDRGGIERVLKSGRRAAEPRHAVRVHLAGG